MMLRVTARHYERDAKAYGTIRLVEAFDVKYDSYFGAEKPEGVQQLWVQNIDLFTLVVCIEQRWFETETLPEQVPVRIGIGSYQKVLEEEKMPIPETVQIFPKGRYAAFFLELDDLHTVAGEKLNPIRAFLRERNLSALRDSTAYLYRVDTVGGKPRFIFCVRVLVEEGETDI